MKPRELAFIVLAFVAMCGWGHALWMARENRRTADESLRLTNEAQIRTNESHRKAADCASALTQAHQELDEARTCTLEDCLDDLMLCCLQLHGCDGLGSGYIDCLSPPEEKKP